jgi:cob(I)alamin adenosyltransferase
MEMQDRPGLPAGFAFQKADLRVEAYGTVDELNTVLGFARSICKNEEIAGWTEQIQKTLFRLGSALATPPESRKPQIYITAEDVEFLTQLVYRSKRRKGSLPIGRCPARIPSQLRMRSRARFAGARSAMRCGWRRAGRRSSRRCWLT